MTQSPTDKTVEAVARAIRLARFERKGRGRAYDPELRLHETELADAQAAITALASIPASPPSPAGDVAEPQTDSLGRTDADLLRLIAKDHERLAPNSYHSAECLRQIADRLAALQPSPSPASNGAMPEKRIVVERDEKGRVMICDGCGTVETVASIRARHATAFTCCPERKMVRAVPEMPAAGMGEVLTALAKVMPIRVNDGPDYAEVYFADGVKHSTQAMTMNPQDWRDLAAAYAALTPDPARDEGGEAHGR